MPDAPVPAALAPVQDGQLPISATAKGMTVTYRFANGKTFTKHGTHPNRDNNPLDLKSSPFTTRHGAIANDRGFGIFPSTDIGLVAGVENFDRIDRHDFKGKGTLTDLITKWSPKKENNTARMIRVIPTAASLKADNVWTLLTPIQKQQFIQA